MTVFIFISLAIAVIGSLIMAAVIAADIEEEFEALIEDIQERTNESKETYTDSNASNKRK